ncbi:MAG: hypothetical protein BK997_03765 [Candidatus Micrarchaeum sp. ARMAN-1]|nr:MAG: hypothetical protein BK997_03765 [Candidatus Micrarchaeum sp. ARMAN-1]OJT94783.1 MAG: hypothetical protein JJ59_01750 [Candidatus Micrarchaeum sp. AZ1]OWP53666.1 MAG: hypothetical protein B2I19_01805 [Thermoplasmatales archaeon ARMAN]
MLFTLKSVAENSPALENCRITGVSQNPKSEILSRSTVFKKFQKAPVRFLAWLQIFAFPAKLMPGLAYVANIMEASNASIARQIFNNIITAIKGYSEALPGIS